MEKQVAIFVCINFLVMGTSHLFQQDAWKEFFATLHAKGKPGAFLNGFLTLFMGSIIVAFHPTWTGPQFLLSAIGWLYLLKSAVIFVYPKWGLRSMASVQSAPRIKLIAAGVGMITISVVLGLCILAGKYD